MKQIEKVNVRLGILQETMEVLRTYGNQGCEGLVLWLGYLDHNDCTVERVLTPPQNSLKSEEGVGYFVTSETLFSLNKFLSSTGLRLLAQIHSHPSSAYHSAADDRYCIVTVEGGFSIVVPNFGVGPCDINAWATYRLIDSVWQKVPKKAMETLFIIEGEPEKPPKSFLSNIKKLFR